VDRQAQPALIRAHCSPDGSQQQGTGGRVAYLQALWWLGSVLLAMLAVTVAKVSPVVQGIVRLIDG
jgi:hypothetical protein